MYTDRLRSMQLSYATSSSCTINSQRVNIALHSDDLIRDQ